jgi:hypothetical protein
MLKYDPGWDVAAVAMASKTTRVNPEAKIAHNLHIRAPVSRSRENQGRRHKIPAHAGIAIKALKGGQAVVISTSYEQRHHT